MFLTLRKFWTLNIPQLRDRVCCSGALRSVIVSYRDLALSPKSLEKPDGKMASLQRLRRRLTASLPTEVADAAGTAATAMRAAVTSVGKTSKLCAEASGRRTAEHPIVILRDTSGTFWDLFCLESFSWGKI